MVRTVDYFFMYNRFIVKSNFDISFNPNYV
jgi:hypothetical protein